MKASPLAVQVYSIVSVSVMPRDYEHRSRSRSRSRGRDRKRSGSRERHRRRRSSRVSRVLEAPDTPRGLVMLKLVSCGMCQSRSRSSPRYDNFRRYEREDRRREEERRGEERRGEDRGRSPAGNGGGGVYGRADTRVGPCGGPLPQGMGVLLVKTPVESFLSMDADKLDCMCFLSAVRRE